ncbi:TerD family protein [bacterium]|nr:MAG: TerD family protein [bacterium]
MAISLAKGQKISLDKEAGGGLTHIVMGLGWDVAQKKGFLGKLSGPASVDLDASCIMFDAAGNAVDAIWFSQLRSKDGSVQHTGDNLTGAGDGDDEQIKVNLSQVPENVKALIFVVNSFTGQSFAQIENAFCRVVNGSNNQEIARYNLSAQGSHTAQIMAKIYRHDGAWKMHAIGEIASGRTFHELMPAMKAAL